MRNLLIFMLLVGIFVIGSRSCHGFHWAFGGVQGTGAVQTENRDVKHFKGIHLDISAEVQIDTAATYQVEISAQPNILALIQTKEEDGVLRVFSTDNFNTSEPVRIKITMPDLNEISVGGSGSVRINNGLATDKMDISIGGSGEVICLQCDFQTLHTSISGSGELTLGGKCQSWQADISGSGEVQAKSLTTQNLNASISGSGTITAEVVNELKAQVSGSGDIFYSGSPTVNSSVSGSGSVKKLEAQ